jgi:hypothetical protein
VVGSLVYFMGLALAITVQSTSPNGSSLWGLVCLHPACCVYFWGDVLSTFEKGKEGLNATTMAVSITTDVSASRPVFFLLLTRSLLWTLVVKPAAQNVSEGPRNLGERGRKYVDY